MKKIIYTLILLVNIACSRIQTLNTEPHLYSERPANIVWLQIAGLSANHLPLIKFNQSVVENKNWFESVDCVGGIFTHNLYQLRPDATKSFLAQVLGSKNIKRDCSDLNHSFLWTDFRKENYRVSILETGVDETDSIENYRYCDSANKFNVDDVRLWKMIQAKGEKNYFHYQETLDAQKKFMQNGVFYDRACATGVCYSSIQNNFKLLLSNTLKEGGKNLFILRDNFYLKTLKKRNLSETKEYLFEIDQMIKWITTTLGPESLLVITGAEGIMFDYPQEGKEWEEFVKSGKNFNYRNSSLMSPVFAKGPSAENFCGIFDESDFARRLNFKAPSKKLNWDAINPF